MRILLDENAPSGLRRILAGHDVRTGPEMGWARYVNGQLLDEAEKAGFEGSSPGIEACRISRISPVEISPVIILSTNAWPIMRTRPQMVQRVVANASPGTSPLPLFIVRDDPRRPPAPTC